MHREEEDRMYLDYHMDPAEVARRIKRQGKLNLNVSHMTCKLHFGTGKEIIYLSLKKRH